MMISRFAKRADRGAAFVEMVVMTPLLLILLIGLMEVGRYGDYVIKVGNAAHAGALFGSQNLASAGDSAGMQAAAQNDAQGLTGLTFNPQPSNFCTCSANTAVTFNCTPTSPSLCTPSTTNHQVLYVTVTVNGQLSSLTNFYGLPASLRTLNVSQTAIMRVSRL